MESGSPWYAMDYASDYEDPRWLAVKNFNRTNPGSTWDMGRSTDFSTGPYFINDASPIIVGGRNSIIKGNGSNVAVMPLPGICTDVDTVIVPYTSGDFTVETGPNGCTQLVHADFAFPWRFNPDEVANIIYAGDGSSVELNSL